MNEKKSKDIGALWENTNASGKRWLNGSISVDGKKIKIIIFKNGYKEKNSHPDYYIYEKEMKWQ